MSNSKYVDYRRQSPNYDPRTHKIDTITVHCYVGQASCESAGEWFSHESTQASCNYFIGADGRVALICDEGSQRSWCTSSPSNDQRAVTIECASDSVHPYGFNQTVYNKLIKLCADICQRNGIASLKWQNNPNLIGQIDKQNITVHRWFKNKACPGDWFMNKLNSGEFCRLVNAEIGGDPEPVPTPTDSLIFTYKVKTKNHGWLPEVQNLNDYAGIENDPIIDIVIKSNKGSVKYRVHNKGGSWLPYVTGYNTADYNNGYAGSDREIDLVEVILIGVPGQQAQYRVSSIGNSGYYDWQYDNVHNPSVGLDGYAGALGRTIDKFQIF